MTEAIVPRGYKQTEVGVIPQDWGVSNLGDIGEALIGLTYDPADVRSDGILVLRASNVQEGALHFEDNVFIDMDVPERFIVRHGDILICVRNGSRELIGKCAKIDERADGVTFGAFMTIFRTPYHRFVFHQLQSQLIKSQIQQHLGATINQITNKSLKSFSVPLPSTRAEQEAIADALSDADAFIESLERLLVKKYQLKQGATQELLTGKKRLPAFEARPCKSTEVGVIPKDWDILRLVDLLKQKPKSGYSGRSSGDARGTRTLSLAATSGGSLILNNSTVKRLEESISADSHLFLEPFDVLVQRSNTVELVGTTAIFDGPTGVYVYPDLMMRLRFREPMTGLWFWRYSNSSAGRRFFRSIAAGSTGSMPKISGAKLCEMPVPVPQLSEQTAITEILSDMDAEITWLKAKLAKARQIKHGMIQDLLTGKIRFV